MPSREIEILRRNLDGQRRAKVSGFSMGPQGMGYRANCRCKDKDCRQTLTVFPDDGVIHFADNQGHVHVFHVGAEEGNALAQDLRELAEKAAE